MNRGDLYNILYRFSTSPIAIAVIIFFLLLIASFSVGMGNDEGMWNYISRLWIHDGVPPYRGGVENKTPGIFIIFAISNLLFDLNIWFPRILGILSLVTTSIVLYLIGHKLYNHLAGVFAMILFGFSMAWMTMDGSFTAQTETFMVLFIVLAFYFLIVTQRAKRFWLYVISLFISGFFMAVAIAFKQTAMFSAIALFVFLLSLDSKHTSVHKNILRDPLFLLAGALFFTCLSLIPLLMSGATIADYWKGAWLILLQGDSSASITSRIPKFIQVWRYSEMLLFYPLVLLFIVQRKRIVENNIPFMGICLWISLDFLGVNASGYYWGHQLKQLMPSLALASGIAVSMLFQTKLIGELEKRRRIVQVIAIIMIFWAPYQTFLQAYAMIKYSPPDASMQLGKWIEMNTKDEDFIYIWGDGGNVIQAYSERRSVSRYFNSLFVGGWAAKQELLNDLKNKKPKFILIGEDRGLVPEIEKIINESYQYKFTESGYHTFEKGNASSKLE